MGHVFISYSHTDSEYAHALADSLHAIGLEVWIDERLDYGSQWPHEIQKQLDSCDAFILVMTPRSFASDWVQSELQRAKRKLKPIFPVLLEGDEPWLSVESTQYYDVRGEELPDQKFYSTLKRVVTVSPVSDTFTRVPKAAVKAGVAASQPDRKRGLMIAGIGGGVILLVACTAVAAIVIFNMLNRPSSPVPTATGEDQLQPGPVNTSENSEIVSTATSRPPTQALPTSTARQPSGTCRDGYVYRLINSSDRVCVSPASKSQAQTDTAEAEEHWAKSVLTNAYGPSACAYGYLWRNLYEGDLVCITPARYQEYQQENTDGPLYTESGSAYCVSGYVWRDAFPFDGDLVCVTPASRDEAQFDNNQSDAYVAANYYNDYDCIPDYVQREAFAGDYVCVEPSVYQQVQQDNAQAPLHTWP